MLAELQPQGSSHCRWASWMHAVELRAGEQNILPCDWLFPILPRPPAEFKPAQKKFKNKKIWEIKTPLPFQSPEERSHRYCDNEGGTDGLTDGPTRKHDARGHGAHQQWTPAITVGRSGVLRRSALGVTWVICEVSELWHVIAGFIRGCLVVVFLCHDAHGNQFGWMDSLNEMRLWWLKSRISRT